MWIVGIPLSHIFGTHEDLDKLNPDLIAPQAKFLIPKRLLHMELPVHPPSDSGYKNEKESKLMNIENEWMWSPAGQDAEKECLK